jgi:Arc/MetJ-type ribon-helix-helix transcriptional regulator
MEKEPYEKRSKRITFAIPKSLYVQVMTKLPYTGYTNISELLRELLRQWVQEGTIIITAKKESV